MKGNNVEHVELLSEGRKQQKIYRIDPTKDIDVESLAEIIELLKLHY